MLRIFQKAGFFACLFFMPIFCIAQQWAFSSTEREAYTRALNLQVSDARHLIGKATTPQQQFVLGLTESLDLLLTEDESLFDKFEEMYEDRIATDPKTRDEYFLQAELRLQWTFVYLKFGHELDAASAFREAYKLATTCRKKFPQYMAIRKPLGLIEIMVGSVPDKYTWVMELLGMRGSVERGLNDLDEVRNSHDEFAFEANLLHGLVNGYILQQPSKAIDIVSGLLRDQPDQKLLLLTGAALAAKNSESEQARQWLEKMMATPVGISTVYPNYFMGEVYLHKGDYSDAIHQYNLFIENFRGKNTLKDAWFKTGLCYLLSGDTDKAREHFAMAREKGAEETEADKSAARTLDEKKLPNVPLSKARYATDGGYYDIAREILNGITDSELSGRKEQVEFYYRKARLEDKSGHREAAQLFYRQVIDMAGDAHWYFAPNSCLQLGYIAVDQNKMSDAKAWFKKVLSYSKHEYKNSIDSKARSALDRLNK